MAYITYIPYKWSNGHNGSPEGIPDELMGCPRGIKVTGGIHMKSRRIGLEVDVEQYEIGKGMEDIREGRVYSADAIEEEMRRDYGI